MTVLGPARTLLAPDRRVGETLRQDGSVPDPTEHVVQFPGVRSFVPRNGVILKLSYPSLTLGPDYLMITTIGPPWTALLGDAPAIVIDRKAVLIRQSNGVAARFKATPRTIQAVVEEFERRGIRFTKSEHSTYGEANALPRATD